ncbi:hypothetical protein CVS42_03985 [Aeromonas veronii]|uniref:AraC family ligand binding domain-containing protein n=1 Tax=Aeromonas TaxID=642 RepID=UPI000C291CC6|nr:AraC family ligand binding domain-containing protein [Aeromonas veronii]ATY80071.1 hypothetical protein CVS42_03985 [Aeromonas veronii]
MHHAIEYHHFSCQGLHAGNRKRTPVGQLLRITRGAALLRLGQHELLLPAGSSFWLCADALAAFNPLSGCEYDQLNVSLRVAQPQQAGWLQTTPLLDALLDSLARWQRPKEWQGAYGQRLQVILDELQQCAISQQDNEALQQCWQALARGEAQALVQWQQLDDVPLAGEELQQQWQLLQALRLLKGGSKPAQVASKLGYADEAALQATCQLWGVGEDGAQ